jgi:hypothetical protein
MDIKAKYKNIIEDTVNYNQLQGIEQAILGYSFSPLVIENVPLADAINLKNKDELLYNIIAQKMAINTYKDSLSIPIPKGTIGRELEINILDSVEVGKVRDKIDQNEIRKVLELYKKRIKRSSAKNNAPKLR